MVIILVCFAICISLPACRRTGPEWIEAGETEPAIIVLEEPPFVVARVYYPEAGVQKCVERELPDSREALFEAWRDLSGLPKEVSVNRAEFCGDEYTETETLGSSTYLRRHFENCRLELDLSAAFLEALDAPDSRLLVATLTRTMLGDSPELPLRLTVEGESAGTGFEDGRGFLTVARFDGV